MFHLLSAAFVREERQCFLSLCFPSIGILYRIPSMWESVCVATEMSENMASGVCLALSHDWAQPARGPNSRTGIANGEWPETLRYHGREYS